MARFSIGVAFGFAVAVLLQCAAAQTTHVVGDDISWTVPSGGAAAYTNWANGKTFVVGDILLFNFTTGAHDVLQVQKASFDACTDSNPIGDVITTGPVNITLDVVGDHFYICTISQHCQFGQKLAISVSATPGASPPPSTTPRPPPPTTPSTPTTPSADCPTSDSPASGPSSKNSPTPGAMAPMTPPPPGSSSSKILAGIYVSMLAAIMGFLF